MNWLELLEIKLPVFAASIMGAIAALTFEEKVSFVRACGIIACGAAAATYTNPVIMHVFGLPEVYGNSVAFFVGLIAMKISNAVLQAASKIDGNDIIGFITKIIGKK